MKTCNGSYTICKSRDKHVVTVEFQKTIIGINPAPTVPIFASRGLSQSYSNIFEARSNGTWCVCSCWLDSKPTYGSLGSFSAL